MKILFGHIIVLSAVVWAQSPTINPLPTREFGQPSLALPVTQASPNYVEGRELYAPGQVAFDTSVSPPIMYIADIGNNRVLGFKSIASLTAGNFADLVIGQQDLFSTLGQGPSTSFTTGFTSPTGVAVDSSGNLYVADAGNNRILRFPAPFKQTSSPVLPDLVIGQKSFGSGSSPNQNGNPSAQTLYFSSGGSTQLTGLAVDSSNNLWTVDPGNNRVLMFPAANLVAHTVLPSATVVLGESDFVSRNGPQGSTRSQTYLGSLDDPSSLALDSSGNLYVADAYSRVLYFQAPIAGQGQFANRVLGVPPQVTSGLPSYPSQYTLGAINSTNNSLIPPNGVFTNGTNLFVADTPQNRIVEYDIPSKWPGATTATPSPAAIAVYGQNGGFATGQANQGMPAPTQFTLSGPTAGGIVNGQMWIADAGNNRVLGFSPTSTGFTGASVVVGQSDFIYNAPNLIEGKEVYLGGVGVINGKGSGMVVDNSSTPPHLYISDPGNNRILGFKNALSVGQTIGVVADIVIGQPNFKTSEINYPIGLAGSPSQTGLYNPVGLAVDNNGNLYVADTGNGRVVRFPAPFSQPAGALQTANLVLGQPDFGTFIQNASANSMHSPWGVALFNDPTGTIPLAGSIAVSDPSYNRVQVFKKGAGGDFANGQNASVVFGQTSFSGTSPTTTSTSLSAFNTPLGIATDTSDRLYVADSLNNRVMEFIQGQETTINGATSTQQLNNINQPWAVAINSLTTELWVANTNGGTVYRYPEYNTCELNSCAPTATLYPEGGYTVGLAVDNSGNVIVGDSANRVTFFFAEAIYRNAANYNTQPLAPGMLVLLGRLGYAFQVQSGAAAVYPWSTTVADVNVSVNGTLAPIFRTGSGLVYAQIPYEAPTSGTVNIIVSHPSTQEVIGVGTFQMAQANPGFFTANSSGTGPVAATNAVDGTPNTSANPVARGAIITFYLTGQGQVPNAPADGQLPVGAIPTPGPLPLVYIQGVQATVQYSGLGAFPGGWQINATVPMEGPVPGAANSVVLSYLGVGSNLGGNPTNNANGTPGNDIQISTSVYVK